MMLNIWTCLWNFFEFFNCAGAFLAGSDLRKQFRATFSNFGMA